MLGDILTIVNEDAPGAAADLLRERRASDGGRRGGGPCSDVQGAWRPDAGRDRQPADEGGGGLRLRPHRRVRALPADDLAPSANPSGRWARRGRAARDVGVLRARAGCDRAPSRRVRRRVSEATQVLFVCVRNAGRSQMAAALVTLHSRGCVAVRSAGSDPGEEIDPVVLQVMAEVGVDLSAAFPKALTAQAVADSDVVVTMGCGDACPVYPGKRYEDWTVEDPAGKDIETVRGIRDEIDRWVRSLVADLTAA